MYCRNCGKQIPDDAKFCPECGASVSETSKSEQYNESGYVGDTNISKKETHEGLFLASKILMVLSCCTLGWALIPLIWLIPMTSKVFKAAKSGEKLSIGFGVCTLIFANTIAGILLLVDRTIE